MIEQYVYLRDNSYVHSLDNHEQDSTVMLAGSTIPYLEPKLVRVISNPYKLQMKNIISGYIEAEFITVEYNNKLYRALNNVSLTKPKREWYQ